MKVTPGLEFVGRNERVNDSECATCDGTRHRHRGGLRAVRYHMLVKSRYRDQWRTARRLIRVARNWL